MLDLTGKVAIVTGAGSVGPGWGNGKATAVLFARQGAAVFCIDNNPAAVAETVGIITGEGGRAVAHTADATRSEDVKAAVEAAVAEFGRLDILVNNVGGSAPGSAESMTEEVWDRQFDINLRSAFLGCKHALPHLRERETAAIVNIASIAALRMSGDRPHIAYSASKMGVIGLTRSGSRWTRRARACAAPPCRFPGADATAAGWKDGCCASSAWRATRGAMIAKRDGTVTTADGHRLWAWRIAVLFSTTTRAANQRQRDRRFFSMADVRDDAGGGHERTLPALGENEMGARTRRSAPCAGLNAGRAGGVFGPSRCCCATQRWRMRCSLGAGCASRLLEDGLREIAFLASRAAGRTQSKWFAHIDRAEGESMPHRSKGALASGTALRRAAEQLVGGFFLSKAVARPTRGRMDDAEIRRRPRRARRPSCLVELLTVLVLHAASFILNVGRCRCGEKPLPRCKLSGKTS